MPYVDLDLPELHRTRLETGWSLQRQKQAYLRAACACTAVSSIRRTSIGQRYRSGRDADKADAAYTKARELARAQAR